MRAIGFANVTTLTSRLSAATGPPVRAGAHSAGVHDYSQEVPLGGANLPMLSADNGLFSER